MRPRRSVSTGGRGGATASRGAGDVLLFPSGGNAIEALDCLGPQRAVGFVDDDPARVGTTLLGLPILDRSALSRIPTASILAVPGSPMSFRRRVTIINGLGLARARFAVACHPTAVVSPHAMIGVNVLIMAGVVVSATAVIEDHVVVLPNAVIHHHARIGAYSMIGSSVVVAGHVSIGECCYIGSGACLRNNIAVAPHTLLGLGATVVRAIDESGGVWAGTPARRLAPPGSSETLGSSASPRTIPPLRDASRSRE